MGPDRGKVAQQREPDAVYKRSSYLCYGYKDCRDKGMGNAGYAQNNRTMYWRMYSGHNCTNYAAYRMVQSGLPNTRPWSGGGNATYWGTSMPRITDDARASAPWPGGGPTPARRLRRPRRLRRAGGLRRRDHRLQDSWGGDFSWAGITRSSGNWPSGFIHFNDVPMANTAPPAISGIAKVGSTLSASAGSWKPSSVAVEYQWFADGQRLKKSTKSTIRLTEAHLGQALTVTATASKLGYRPRA